MLSEEGNPAEVEPSGGVHDGGGEKQNPELVHIEHCCGNEAGRNIATNTPAQFL